MHIVYLVHSFSWDGRYVGGAGQYVANIANIMVKQGHEVDVIVEASFSDVIDINGIRVHPVNEVGDFVKGGPLSTRQKVYRNLKRSYWYNKKVKEIHKKNKIDIVQSANIFGLALLRNRRIPYVVRMSDYPSLWRHFVSIECDYQDAMRTRRLDEELSLLACKRADRVIAPSILLKELLKKRWNKDVTIIESPVDISCVNGAVLQEPEIESDKYLVTYGRLSYRKEIHIIAQIIDDFLEKYPDMKYVIIGENSKVKHNEKNIAVWDYLKLHVENHSDRLVLMKDISDRKRLFGIIKNAYACVLPTRIDNLPNAVLEAMALGKIIVSSTSEYGTSVEQLITDGESGFLAQVDDEESLLCKIDQAMSLSQEKKQTIEQKAKDRVKDLTPEKVYKKMIDIYQEVIEKHRN